jgi:magnesium-transporting ATPase (P-type)
MPKSQPSSASNDKRKPILFLAILTAVFSVIAIIFFRRWRSKQAHKPVPRVPPPPAIAPTELRGLTEAEATERRLQSQDNTVLFKPPRSRKAIIRQNTFTIFNLSLISLAIVQFLLGNLLDGLISLGIIILNVGVNTFQEELARYRLKKTEQATRPKATVIREGKIRSLDPAEIVLDDLVVAGPGDQILVDGEVVGQGSMTVDETMLNGQNPHLARRVGDPVLAGSFCIAGRAAYRATKVGNDRWVVSQLAVNQEKPEEMTPLERIINRILTILLAFVLIFGGILMIRYFRVDIGKISTQVVADAASVFFNVASPGLFFMILLTYVGRTADMAKLGALVHRTRSVETLAEINDICLANQGILIGESVNLQVLEPPTDQEHLAESRIRQILGDFAHSDLNKNPITQAIATSFPGSQRQSVEQAPFFSVYGWMAQSYDEDDLRGVFVLGDPDALQENLIAVKKLASIEKQAETSPSGLSKATSALGRIFRRKGKKEIQKSEEKANPLSAPEAASSEQVDPPSDQSADPPEEAPQPKQNIFKRLGGRIARIVQREKQVQAPEEPKETASTEMVGLVFAYIPKLIPLHNTDGLPLLPNELVALGKLHFTEQVLPEVVQTLKTFSETGVDIRIFVAGPTSKFIEETRKAGWNQTSDAFFAETSPKRAAQIIQQLQAEGRMVAMVGDQVYDVLPMRQANLTIARKSSSQAALSLADIILLEDSPKVLLAVLELGQRIVHGLLDVLNLYLTQAIYLVLLILSLVLLYHHFPYKSAQGSVISIITLTIPAIGLSLWGKRGSLATSHLARTLFRFVAPAAVTISLVGQFVFEFFLNQSGKPAYAQLTLTYFLVFAGLALVIFLRPPLQLLSILRPWEKPAAEAPDWKPTLLAIASLIVFLIMLKIPLAQKSFLIVPLDQSTDYVMIILAFAGWAVLLSLVRWVISLPIFVRYSSRNTLKGSTNVRPF